MEKNKSIIIVAILFILIAPLQANVERLNSIITYKDSVWYKTNYNYNSSNQITNYIIVYSLDKQDWNNLSYSIRSYQNDAVSEIYDYIWKDNTWKLHKTQIYEQTTDNIKTHISITGNTKEVITSEKNDTIHTEKYSIFRNDTLLNSNISIKKFNNNNLVWVKIASLSAPNDTTSAQYTTFNYTDNKTLSTTYEKIDSRYTPTHKTEQYLNSNNAIISEIQSTYNDNQWVYSAKISYTYTQTNSIKDITYQIWNNNYWLNVLKKQFEYNNDGSINTCNILELIYKEWHVTYQISYHYRNTNQLEYANISQTFWSETDQLYNDFIEITPCNGISYINANSAEFIYDEISTNIILNHSPINIYPNPTKTGIVFINSDIIVYDIAIYNINGILVYKNKYCEHIDLSHLENGIYIMKMTTEEGIFSHKQIVNNY